MVKHQHAVATPNGEYNFHRPIAIFKDWLDYHMVRDHPIETVKLNQREQSKKDRKSLEMMNRVSCFFLFYVFVLFFLTLAHAQIYGHIMHNRLSCLPLMSSPGYGKQADEMWKDVAELKRFSENVQSLIDLLAKKPEPTSIEDEPANVVPAIHLGELMITWRLRAQTFEKGLPDLDFKEHHNQRINKSLPGTVMRPDSSFRPGVDEIKIKNQETEKLIDRCMDLLDHTACNWAEFHNKTSLVLKYVKFCLFSEDIRAIYLSRLFKNQRIVTFFQAIHSEMEEDIDSVLIDIPKLKGKEKENERDVSRIHAGMAYSSLERYDMELQSALGSLTRLVMEHGTVAGKIGENVMKGYKPLVLVRSSVCFTKKNHVVLTCFVRR
jgi:hypothetical protein